MLIIGLILCTGCSNSDYTEDIVITGSDYLVLESSVQNKELCLAFTFDDWSYDYDVRTVRAKFSRSNADIPLKWELLVSDRASSEQLLWYNNGINNGSLVWTDCYTLEDYLFLTVESNTICTITCEQPFGCEFMIRCSVVADPSIFDCIYINFNKKVVSVNGGSFYSNDPNLKNNGLTCYSLSTTPYTYEFYPSYTYYGTYTTEKDFGYNYGYIYFKWHNSDQNAFEYLFNHCSKNTLGVVVSSGLSDYAYYIDSFTLDVDFLCYLMFGDAFTDPFNNIDLCDDSDYAKEQMRNCVKSALDVIGELTDKVYFIDYYIMLDSEYYGPYQTILRDVDYE